MRTAATLITALLASAVTTYAAPSVGSDVLVSYFDKDSLLLSNSIGGFTYDPARDSFTVAGFAGAFQGIYEVTPTSGTSSSLTWDGDQWTSSADFSSTLLASESDLLFFARATDLSGSGNGDPNLSGQPTPGNLRLNPASITIDGTTYAPGELLVFTDGMYIRDPLNDNTPVDDAAKIIYTYDRREVGTANTGRDRNSNGTVDYNDVFDIIATRQDFRDTFGGTGSFNMARSHAFASDGQSVYLNDAGSTYGGLYQVSLTTGTITQLVAAPDTPRINTEPSVIPTSLIDLDPDDGLTGDQIIFESSSASGLDDDDFSGLDYIVTGPQGTSSVRTLVSYETIADQIGGGDVRILSTGVSSDGRVFFYESDSTDALFELDPATGNVAKVVSERQHNEFQAEFGVDNANDNFLDMITRTVSITNDGNTFDVLEVLFSDSSFDAPVGALAYKPGDLNRDNTVDLTDYHLLAASRLSDFATEELAGPSALNAYLAADMSADDDVTDLDASIFFAWNPLVADLDNSGTTDLADADFLIANTFDFNGDTTYDATDLNGIIIDALGLTPADLNADGAVDLLDLSALATHFNQTDTGYTGGDFNGDGTTDLLDLSILATHFGTTTVPTPATAALLTLGLLIGTRKQA